MISRQHPAYDMHPHCLAGLADNFADPLAHWVLQNPVTIFCDPHGMEPVVKSCVRG